jgi:hypothetical protein
MLIGAITAEGKQRIFFAAIVKDDQDLAEKAMRRHFELVDTRIG